MPRWTANDYALWIARQNKALNPGAATEPEPIVRGQSLAADEDKASSAKRPVVRITGFRLRLLDPDDQCVKYHVDAIRYAGLLDGDSEKQIEIQIMPQIKVKTKQEERVEIEIIYDNDRTIPGVGG